ncbi:MAG: LysM peptidoglycan-binding domain-containing protein [Chloroflexi bacterium]|nr:LysM peptidoglycan-binding domain-containing protein [Chloroflexota bacterium]
MQPKRFLILLAGILLVLVLAACERPASTPPPAEETQQGEFPVPGSTDDVMGQLETFATQTAIAMSGGAAEKTPEAPAAQETAAPTPEATQAPAATQEPAQPASVTLPTKTPGTPASWTLQKGEHPYCIARRFDVNPNEMLNLSGLAAGGSYPPGTVLKIPTSGNTFPAGRALKDHPDTYTVGSGDSIYSIACEYGDVDPYDIAAANGLAAPYKLSAGQELKIP